MKIFFAESRDDPHRLITLADAGARNFLFSYHYRGCNRFDLETGLFRTIVHAGPENCSLLVDSGAFSAMTKGAEVDRIEYARWAKRLSDKWDGKLRFLRFFNLDSIGDQKRTWENQAFYDKIGFPTIPVVTYGAKERDFMRALDYDMIGLGGLVPLATKGKKKQLFAWLDWCFRTVVKMRGTKLPRIHLLGITSAEICKRYPIYSSDSSSWTYPARFGVSKRFTGKTPGIKACPEATMLSIRAEIHHFLSLERVATSLWEKRGIAWRE